MDKKIIRVQIKVEGSCVVFDTGLQLGKLQGFQEEINLENGRTIILTYEK